MTHYPDTQLFIAGRWQPAANGHTLPVVNPATGHEIGRVAHASRNDMDRAIAAAASGFHHWRNVPAFDRAQVMRHAAQLLRERAEDIAIAMTQDQGKPLTESRGEVLSAAGIIEWFADEGQRAYGRVIPPRAGNVLQLVNKAPVGPVAAFTPWNFPINQVVRKLAAALATGCSMVIKAPEETPSGPAALVRAFADAGLPDGVVGLLFGEPAEISSHLIASPVIRKITFTGSTAIGKQLAAQAGAHMKRCTMELGGHAPFIVTEDADLEMAVRMAGTTKYRNAGQVCVSPTRFLVHRSHYRDFVDGLAAQAQALTVGNGLSPDTRMGPLANPRRLAAMEALTDDAQARGATVRAGGVAREGEGNFWLPTVLADVPLDARIFNEEPFGPIASVRPYDELDEAIAEANRLPYGLSTYAYTRSLSTMHRMSREIETGMLWVNQPSNAWPELPFGGIKDSGYGSEGGPEALEAYMDTRLVAMTT
jgi:succinate-semialdehyde dehydrogenase/glutarate-semialdehyde dehydrogenase